MNNLFKKSFYLTKTYLKKDWLLLTGTFTSIVALVVGVAAVFAQMYDSLSSRLAMIETIKQPAMKAIVGIYHGNNSLGSFFTSIMIIWTAILGIIFAIIIAVRNTRAQEESNLSELLLSKSIGRLSLPMASFLELLLLFTTIFIGNFFGLVALNIGGLSAESAFLFSLSASLVPLLFGVLTILYAQLANTTSGVNILSYVTFLLSYMIIIYGSQTKSGHLLWLSPLGWLSNISLTDQNYYLPIMLMVIFILTGLVLALLLQFNRDLGSGLLPTPKGKSKASALLSGFSTLTFKNQVTSMVVWIGIMFCTGIAYGSVFQDISKIASSNPYLMQMIAKQKGLMVTNFSFMILGIFAVVALIPGILHIYKLKSDETKGYLELVHSKKISRTKVFTTYTGIGLMVSLLTFISGSLGMFIAQNQSLKHPISLTHFSIAITSYLPIMLFVLSFGAILVTLVPKLVNLIWLVLYYGFFINYFGKLFKLSDWAINISMFGLIKRNWTHPLTTNYIIMFTTLAIVLLVVSLIKYQKRDLVY